MKRILALLICTALLAACMCGCGAKTQMPAAQSTPEAETTPAAENTAITITDLAGETYTFDKPLEKVVIQSSGSGGAFFTMAALFGDELCDHIAGWDPGLSKNRQDMYNQFLKTMPELAELNNVGAAGSDDFNLEKVISSGAEAFIYAYSGAATLQEDIQPKLEAAGIPVIYIDFHAETIENHTQSVTLLGKLFGKEERAQEIVDFYNSHMERVNEGVSKMLKTNERPTVYVECAQKSPDEYGNSYPNDLMWGGIIYNMGGTSIADGIVDSYAPLEPEYVLSQNPDKILFTGSIWENSPDAIRMGFGANEDETRAIVGRYLERPGYSELDAVKNGEVYVVHHVLSRDIYDCASMEAVAKYIWPEEFEDLDPTATLKDFFDKFLPFDFEGLWYMKY